MQFAFEKARFSFDARKVQPGSVAHFHMDAHVARTALDGEFGDALPVVETVVLDPKNVPQMGAGECIITIVAAAIGNAVFDDVFDLSEFKYETLRMVQPIGEFFILLKVLVAAVPTGMLTPNILAL